MRTFQANIEQNKYRSYSGIFSSTSFNKLLRTGDLDFIQARIQQYDRLNYNKGEFSTYLEYIKHAYNEMGKNYRNEYFYKNSFIDKLLINHYGVKETVVMSEFKVGNSVADLVMFNGLSKAFEIKTELDSKARLLGQITDYRKVFNECYIITDETLTAKYAAEDENTGIIALKKGSRGITLTVVRKAKFNTTIEPEVIMRCLRTNEYKNIVKAYYGLLPEMTSFTMFDICSDMIKQIPQKELSELFICEVKKRKSNTAQLKNYNKELRQLALAMNLDKKKYEDIIDKLNKPIKI
ncbi:MAG: sce7726 family protein [Salinivirgaceae bacterium]|jgi:hypothetical protein|nr:sce7726 family protein [Salinivirgaceae bacterium]